MATTLTPDQLGATVSGFFVTTASYVWIIFKLLFFIACIVLVIYLLFFNVKVIIAEQSKNNRVILTTKRMKEIKSKDGKIKLATFSFMNFIKGMTIDLPSTECLFPFRDTLRLHNKCYIFVKKDGVYHPVNNLVAGLKYLQTETIENPEKPGEFIEVTREVYSLEGSGLELTRDFNAEQAISNDLMAAADRYRNKKPVETFMLMGLMVIVIIGSFIVLFYAFKQVGVLSESISQLSQPLREGVTNAINQRLGPG